MVLFAKNAIARSYLLAYRNFATTKTNLFAELIPKIPKPCPRVPHPEHMSSKL
jgi:hypothetical protein